MKRGLCLLAAIASLLGAAPPALAQGCGYFAILGCYRDPAAAQDWNARIEYGHVIDTSSLRYPNFQSGWYCVVHGPTSRARAEDVARGWRRFIREAYVKSNC